MGKVKDGDGTALKPMRRWQVLHRTMFGVQHAGHAYVIDVSIFDDKAACYVDGHQRYIAELPAKFSVPDGRIEVASSTYGLKRMHLVRDGEPDHQLSPAPYTAEWWRALLGERHPRLSRWIGRIAVVVLLLGLAVLVPEIAELVSQTEIVSQNLGTFTSPIELPAWATTTLTVAGVIAGIERALTLRNHWLIDMDTFWFD